MLAITLVVGIVAGLLGHQVLVAQQAPIKRTILQQNDLEGVPGKEVIMFRADIAPGAVLGAHYHSGPEMFYVAQGTFLFEPKGQPSVTLKAGESSYAPTKLIHSGKNASTTEPLTLIGFWVAEKGQPLATPVK
jgi:quercetin dioxygenase-like cupin family protein